MSEQTYTYIIVGGGLAGASAVKGIRDVDTQGSILLIAGEKYLPYNRPPLTKQLWFGKKRVEDIFANPREYYRDRQVDTLLLDSVVKLNAAEKSVNDSRGQLFRYRQAAVGHRRQAAHRRDSRGARWRTSVTTATWMIISPFMHWPVRENRR